MKVLNLSELCHTVYEGKRNHQELAVLFHGTCLNEILLVGFFFFFCILSFFVILFRLFGVFCLFASFVLKCIGNS